MDGDCKEDGKLNPCASHEGIYVPSTTLQGFTVEANMNMALGELPISTTLNMIAPL